MGEFMTPKATELQVKDPFASQYGPWLKEFMSQKQGDHPQVQKPGTPYMDWGMKQAQQSLMSDLPQTRDYLTQQLQTGNLQNVNPLLQQAEGLNRSRQQEAIAMIQNQLGRGSERSQAGYQGINPMLQELAMNSENARLQAQYKAQEQRNMAAQGLGNLAQLYGIPGQIEAQKLGLGAQYDLANLQAQQNLQNLQAQMTGQMMGQRYMPEYLYEPSMFDQYVSPFLNAGLGFLGNAASPFLEGLFGTPLNGNQRQGSYGNPATSQRQ